MRKTKTVGAWVDVAGGTIAFGCARVANDAPLLAIAAMILVATGFHIVVDRPWEVPEPEQVAPMPSNYVIGAGRRRGLARPVALVGLIAFYLGIVIFGNGGLRLVMGAIAFGDGAGDLIRRHAIARWEDEHDLELLMDEPRGEERYYGRPRRSSGRG